MYHGMSAWAFMEINKKIGSTSLHISFATCIIDLGRSGEEGPKSQCSQNGRSEEEYPFFFFSLLCLSLHRIIIVLFSKLVR